MGRMKERAPLLGSPWLLLWLLGSIGVIGTSSYTPNDLDRQYDDSPIALNLAIPLSSSSTPGLTTRQLARRTKTTSASASFTSLTSAVTPLPDTVENSSIEFRFTSHLYNVSIPENSMGKTYVTPEEKMGIELKDSHRSYEEIKFRIVSGDKDKFFKAEERVVGDFCFLLLRTRTGNNDVLNRERKDKYVLDIRASAKRHDGRNKVSWLEAQTSVAVTILDTNDLNPLFYPTKYEATVTEDTPMHRSIIKVIAEDADLGRNGEIYYSFAEKTEQFAVHPVSGVVTLTRPLR